MTTTGDAITEALRQCLDLIDAGEAPDQALARFPHQRDELEPLVRTALAVRGLEIPGAPASVLAGLAEALNLDAPAAGGSEAHDGAWREQVRRWLDAGLATIRPPDGQAWARAAALVVAALLLVGTVAIATSRLTGGGPPDDARRETAEGGGGMSATAVARGVDADGRDGYSLTGAPGGGQVDATADEPVGPRTGVSSVASAGTVAAAATGTAAARGTELAAGADAADTAPVVVVIVPHPPTVPPTSPAEVPSATPPQETGGEPGPTQRPPKPSATRAPTEDGAPTEPAGPSESPTAATPAGPTLVPTADPTRIASQVVISVLVADLDGAALPGAVVRGWDEDTEAFSTCTTGASGACDLRFDSPGRFVVHAELTSPPVGRWFDGKTSREDADRITLDSPGDVQDILLILPVGAVPPPTSTPPVAWAASAHSTPDIGAGAALATVAAAPRQP
ncbi:MAG: hypothetical protein ACK2UL_01655 [Anaerolineae bacterium]